MGWWTRPRLEYEQLLFRLGSMLSKSTANLEPGVILLEKDASDRSAWLWIGAFLQVTMPDRVVADISVDGDGARQITVPLKWWSYESEAQVTGIDPRWCFVHAHVEVSDLSPGGVYRATATVQAEGRSFSSTCRIKLLPAIVEDERPLTVFTASCYDIDTDRADRFARSISVAFPRTGVGGDGPDVTLLLGDQVYLDAPWWHYAALARHTPRTYYLSRYWRTWGGSGSCGLRTLLSSGPNWFLPDDHEFWNNWPHRTATAKHSASKVLAAIRNSRERSRWLDFDALPFDDPEAMAVWRQNHDPVDPDEWDAWSRGAFDLFGSFQTRAPAGLTAGENQPHDSTREPVNQLVQQFHVHPIDFVLLDTRTRRVRRHDTPLAAFVDPEAVEAVLASARSAEILVLGLAQPLLRASKYPNTSAAEFPTDRSRSTDRGMEDYWAQYQYFWKGLLDARMGRPTIVLGGDIHRSYIGFAPELSLVEVVASPMSLVYGGRVLNRLGRIKRGAGELTRFRNPMWRDPFQVDEPYVSYADVLSGPLAMGDDITEGGPVCVEKLDSMTCGFASMKFSRRGSIGNEILRLEVCLFDRDGLVSRGVDTRSARRVSFDLTSTSAPGSIRRVP